MKKLTILRMINHGLSSIQLNNKQDYQKLVPKNATELSIQNWANINNRLHKAIKAVKYDNEI